MAAIKGGEGKLGKALAAACGLLGFFCNPTATTEINTAVLGYTEPGRVSAVEGIVEGNHVLDDGKTIGVHFVFDTLTGASANGATPSLGVQTFTRPSGMGVYKADSGTTPLDDTFKDTRGALAVNGSMPLNRLTTWGLGLYGSGEHDYTSLGANTSLTRDLNRKNTTLSLRSAYFRDAVAPEGGRPVPLAAMAPPGGLQPRLAGDGTKTTLDLTFGLTQVIDRRTVFAANYTHSRVRGYQNDPYKILSQVDPVTGAPTDYIYENRPGARDKDMVYGELVRSLGDDSARLSYRYYQDDWGISSHTFDVRYRKQLGARQYVQPHVRIYRQDRADFYRRFLLEGEPLPDAASADYRLGDMHGLTLGLEFGRVLASGNTLTLRAEYYRQTFSAGDTIPVGQLRTLDLFPAVDAYIFQVGWSFDPGAIGGG